MRNVINVDAVRAMEKVGDLRSKKTADVPRLAQTWTRSYPHPAIPIPGCPTPSRNLFADNETPV